MADTYSLIQNCNDAVARSKCAAMFSLDNEFDALKVKRDVDRLAKPQRRIGDATGPQIAQLFREASAMAPPSGSGAGRCITREPRVRPRDGPNRRGMRIEARSSEDLR